MQGTLITGKKGNKHIHSEWFCEEVYTNFHDKITVLFSDKLSKDAILLRLNLDEAIELQHQLNLAIQKLSNATAP